MVSSASSSASAIAATTSSAWPGVRPAFCWVPGVTGSADTAPVHSGRSLAGSRCTVPRGPNVFTRLCSDCTAARTSLRVRPVSRSPIDHSAAAITWACAPQMAVAARSGAAPASGADIPCRAIRLAQACAQERRGSSAGRCVTLVV
jgi:hypothetical protein